MSLFEFGQIVTTAGIAAKMEEDVQFNQWVTKCLSMYEIGNWGTCCKEDQEANTEALKLGNRLMGVYQEDRINMPKIYIITECDRSVTTILFPEEY